MQNLLTQLLGDRLRHWRIDIAGVFRRDRFDQHDPAFFIRHRVVHYSFRNDVYVAGVELNLVTFELHPQPSAHDQKEFVLIRMVVPNELAFYFRDLYVLIVDTADHFWRPVFANLVKALFNIGFHPGVTSRVEIIRLIKYKRQLDMSQKVDVTIRRGNSDDARLLAELGAYTFHETFAVDNTSEDMDAYLASNFNVAQQTAELAHPASTFLIAEVDGQAAGYAKLHAAEPPKEIEGGRPIELVRLYVSSEWFGRGVGEALMRACLDEARNTGHETLWLGVWERNARAQAFYRKWDFRAVGEHMFQLGSDEQRDILMERAL